MRDKKISFRNLAESLWGRGGTHSYKTNRKGAYYYSCSGHGGYLVKASSLTEEERTNIEKYIKPEVLPVLVHEGNVVGVDYSAVARHIYRSRKIFRVPFGSEWEDYVFYSFEEDCAWSVLEKFTDIRLINSNSREASIEPTFERWFGSKKEMQASVAN